MVLGGRRDWWLRDILMRVRSGHLEVTPRPERYAGCEEWSTDAQYEHVEISRWIFSSALALATAAALAAALVVAGEGARAAVGGGLDGLLPWLRTG